MKKFKIPCDFGGKKVPFDLYIGKKSPHKHPLHFQNIWLKSDRGGKIPEEVMKSFFKLKNIAVENNVDFEELCMYALGNAVTENKEEIEKYPIEKLINGKKMRTDKLYLLKAFKTYSNSTFLFDSKKRYERAFSKHDVRYVYYELQLYNRLEGWEEWKPRIEVVCLNIADNKEIYRLSEDDLTIKRNQAVITVKQGWGNATKPWWKHGTYKLSAFVEEKVAGETYFYINDFEKPLNQMLPLLEINTIRFFENSSTTPSLQERKYTTVFQSKEARYIYWEIDAKCSYSEKAWYAEIISKTFNSSYDLISELSHIETISKNKEKINVCSGWGSESGNSWAKGEYFTKFFLFGKEIATKTFTIE